MLSSRINVVCNTLLAMFGIAYL